MKKLLLGVALMLALTGFSQNGGQNYSNQFVSLSNYGWTNGTLKLKITNKQLTESSFRITVNDTHYEVGPIAAGASIDYFIVTPENCLVKVQCKPLPPPGYPGPDMGQVEAGCMQGPDLIGLPVKFISIKIVKRNP